MLQRRRRVTLTVLACLTLPALMVGCTDEDKEATAEAEAAAAAEEAAADAVEEKETTENLRYLAGLAKAGEQMESVGATLEAADGFEAFEAALTDTEAAVESFRELSPPASVSAEHQQMVKSLDDAVAALSGITATSAEADDQAAIAAATAALEDAEASANTIFETLSAE